MRILILGDSLSAPRPATGQAIECTWPVLLKQEMPEAEIWYRARIRSTSREVLEELNLFLDSLHFFDAIIVQVGIVDAAPRPYGHAIQRFIWAFGGTTLTKLTNRYAYNLLKLFPGRPWITAARFRSNLETLVEKSALRNKSLRLVLIKIAPPRARILAVAPRIQEYVKKYNQVLAEVAAANASNFVYLVDPFANGNPSDLVIEDGHHLSELGHKAVTHSIVHALGVDSEWNSTVR
jgi:lysophospholipase L1-like esterase